MDRFLSSSINRIDSKGRVSVPGPFRSLAAKRGYQDLYALRALEEPALNVGGPDLLDLYERQLAAQDPFLQTADDMSAYLHGDGMFLRLDGDGRITITEQIREYIGLTTEVGFLGRGQFFQIWEPQAMSRYMADVRARMLALRKSAAGRQAQGTPE